jgi:hypothetical protein
MYVKLLKPPGYCRVNMQIHTLRTNYNKVLILQLLHVSCLNGHYMYHQLNIQQFYVLPTQCIYVVCVGVRTNINLCPLHHKLIRFYNLNSKCLQRVTDWIFKYSSLRLVFIGLTNKNRCATGRRRYPHVHTAYCRVHKHGNQLTLTCLDGV